MEAKMVKIVSILFAIFLILPKSACFRCPVGSLISRHGHCLPCDRYICANGICDGERCRCGNDYYLNNLNEDSQCVSRDLDGSYENRYELDQSECECNFGICLPSGGCKCIKGSDFNHSTGTCDQMCNSSCLNGKCVAPNFCKCNDGYAHKQYSNEKALMIQDSLTCIPVCNPKCENSVCTQPNVCLCNRGYVQDRNSNECKSLTTSSVKADTTTTSTATSFLMTSTSTASSQEMFHQSNDTNASIISNNTQFDKVESTDSSEIEQKYTFPTTSLLGTIISIIAIGVVIAIIVYIIKRRRNIAYSKFSYRRNMLEEDECELDEGL